MLLPKEVDRQVIFLQLKGKIYKSALMKSEDNNSSDVE